MTGFDDIEMDDVFDPTDAAMDSVSEDNDLMKLPRVARYAMWANRRDARQRLAGEIADGAPVLADLAWDWAQGEQRDEGLALASLLDGLAADADAPRLRSMADAVRVLSLQVPLGLLARRAVRRVAACLHATIAGRSDRWPPEGLSAESRAAVEALAAGWCAISVTPDSLLPRYGMVSMLARNFGQDFVEGASAIASRRSEQTAAPIETPGRNLQDTVSGEVPDGHVLVCRAPEDTKSRSRLKEPLRGHEHVCEPLPLVPIPDLGALVRQLSAEYPYARSEIARLLEPLGGRTSFWLPPTVLVGSPGSGKSRLLRRLCELAGIPVWRSDAARADGASFAGTERRWHSCEPCHPLLAISWTRVANPAILLDELEKAATRQDYGRLWDAMLAFCEPETARRYGDPALQLDVDLGHVSILCTANSIDPLPAPLRDRLRIIQIPEPREEDLPGLVSSLFSETARERGQDLRWFEPLSGEEEECIRAVWRGGSVRKLRRLLDAVLKARDRPTGALN